MKHIVIGLSSCLLLLGQVAADQTKPASRHSHSDSHHEAITVDFPTSCPSVQHDFNVAVALMHNMTYAVARDRFKQIIQKDPTCGMAHWGAAYAVGPNYNKGWDFFEPEERIALIEMLWEVAYADGELHDYEASLIRRITGLLYVSDRDSGEARKRVRARLGLS